MSLQMAAQQAEQTGDSALAIIISVIAAIAAVAAVVLSKRALDYAKGEPLRAAQRALNEQLREKVNSLITEVEGLQSALRSGNNIPEEPVELDECQKFLEGLAQRRPNDTDALRHQWTAAHLVSLSINWSSAAHKQRRVDEVAKYLVKRRAEGGANLEERQAQLTKDQRARDASYLEIQGKAEKALQALKGEIRVLNELDRGESKG